MFFLCYNFFYYYYFYILLFYSLLYRCLSPRGPPCIRKSKNITLNDDEYYSFSLSLYLPTYLPTYKREWKMVRLMNIEPRWKWENEWIWERERERERETSMVWCHQLLLFINNQRWESSRITTRTDASFIPDIYLDMLNYI